MIEHPSAFISDRLQSPLVGDSMSNGNGVVQGSVRANSALYASTKSTNRKKHKKKQHDSFQRKSKAPLAPNEGGKAPGRAISEDELSTHLNSKLNYGKRGPVSPQARTRGIIEADSEDDMEYISDRQKEQQFFLRQLNNRPTLVLNANYLVSRGHPLEISRTIFLCCWSLTDGRILLQIFLVVISHWGICHWVSGLGRMRWKQFSRGVSPWWMFTPMSLSRHRTWRSPSPLSLLLTITSTRRKWSLRLHEEMSF